MQFCGFAPAWNGDVPDRYDSLSCWRNQVPTALTTSSSDSNFLPQTANRWKSEDGKSGVWGGCGRLRNVMAHAQKPYFVFRRNGLVHLNRRGRQFSRLLAAELCASAVVMLDTTCSKVVWRVLAKLAKFPLHFPSRASPYAITFQLDCTIAFKYRCPEICPRTSELSPWSVLVAKGT